MHNPKLPNIQIVLLPTVLVYPPITNNSKWVLLLAGEGVRYHTVIPKTLSILTPNAV